jgi:hypothetical protein
MNLNFEEIYRIHCQGYHTKFYSRNYSKLWCSTITTEWINNKTFSYLTNPENIEGKFYYVTRRKDFGYEPLFTWRNGLLGTVSIERFNEFITQLTSLVEVNLMVKDVHKKLFKKHVLSMTLAIIFVLISVGFFVYIPFSIYRFYPLFITMALVFLILFIIMIMMIPRKHVRDYEIYTYYLINTNVIEDFINSWNNEYFLQNGVYVTCPRNMKYLQFNIGINRLMIFDRHVFPYEI